MRYRLHFLQLLIATGTLTTGQVSATSVGGLGRVVGGGEWVCPRAPPTWTSRRRRPGPSWADMPASETDESADNHARASAAVGGSTAGVSGAGGAVDASERSSHKRERCRHVIHTSNRGGLFGVSACPASIAADGRSMLAAWACCAFRLVPPRGSLVLPPPAPKRAIRPRRRSSAVETSTVTTISSRRAGSRWRELWAASSAA